MSHRSTRSGRAALAALALCAVAAAPSALAAQSAAAPAADPAARADSIHRPHVLDAVVVTAAERDGLLTRVWRGIGARAELAALERGNRALEYQIRAYDHRIARLERRVAELRAPRDAMLRQIAMTDSATAAVRGERERLEARVRALEATGGSE
jgi:hypothetical protein